MKKVQVSRTPLVTEKISKIRTYSDYLIPGKFQKEIINYFRHSSLNSLIKYSYSQGYFWICLRQGLMIALVKTMQTRLTLNSEIFLFLHKGVCHQVHPHSQVYQYQNFYLMISGRRGTLLFVQKSTYIIQSSWKS